MAAFPNFDNSNSNEVGLNFDVLSGLNFEFFESQQRQTENGNRNNDSATASSLVSSASLTSQASHNFYSSLSSNMLPTPEGSGSDNNAMCPESLMLSPYNILPGSGHLNMEDSYNKDEEFFYEPLESPESGVSFIPNYLSAASYISPQTSPTLPPDVPGNINPNSPTRRQSQEKRFSPLARPKKVSPNNKNSVSQTRRKSSFTNSNNANGNNSNNSANGQNNAITNLSNIMTGSPDKLTSNSIAMLSLLELELTSPLMNDVVATSIAPSLQDTMPNLNLGSNLESDVTSAHSSTNIRPIESSSSDKLAPITPSSLMKMKKKQPNSPKSIQNELNTNSLQQQQKQQNQQDQSQQQKDYSAFIAPTPPVQLNQVRSNMIATTGAAFPSGTSGKKSIRSNPASSPLALGPSKSPHSLKPAISPNLKPKLHGVLANEAAAEQLANKSNYRSILDGSAQSFGISYPSDVHSSLESRRTTHKAAEQKRRDSLKQSFDELKKVVPYQSMLNKGDGNVANNSKNGKSGDGTMKNVSKLFLLKRAHDHIVELEQKSKEKDEIIQKLKDELDMLKRTKRQKIEETEKKENVDDEVDIETKSKNERQISSNEC